MEIIVGLDDDDPTTPQAIKLIEDAKLPGVKIFSVERFPTVAMLFNELVRFAKGDWLLTFPDDYVMGQEDWVERLQSTIDILPNGFGVPYLQDPLYPNFTTFPVISTKLVEMQGFFLPPFFPFLFGDTWWNEIAAMSGLMFPAPASVQICADTGNEHNYVDLKLWADMFEATRPMREDMAVKILDGAFGVHALHLINSMPERKARLIELQAEFRTPAFIAKWEAHGRGKYNNPNYESLKKKAQSFLERT